MSRAVRVDRGYFFLVALILVGGCRTGYPSAEGTDTGVLGDSAMDALRIDSSAPPPDSSLPLPMDADAGDTSIETSPPDGGGDGCAEELEAAFVDMDGDGVGAGPAVSICPGASGYAGSNGDCDDGDSRVFPGQLMYFGSARGDGSFDYDCSGSDTAEYRLEFMCAGGGGCTLLRAGFHPPVPTCGESGSFVSDCTGASMCMTAESLQNQRCR